MAALSGEKSLAELSVEFGVHPTMISSWKQERVKRAGELFARGSKAPAVEDAQKVNDDLHRKIGQLQVERDFLAGQPAISRVLEAGDDRAGGGAVRKPAMHAARDCAQQLLLSAPAGVRRGTRSSEAAPPDFHRRSGLRQPATASGALAGGGSGRASAHPAADEEARAVGSQAEAEHQQAEPRAQGLSVPSSRQGD